MKSQRRRAADFGRRGFGVAAIALATLAAASFSGCFESPLPDDVPSEPSAVAPSAAGRATAAETGESGSGTGLSGRAVLDKMVEVYQNASSYADRGQVRIAGTVNGKEFKQAASYVVALERPNKIRLEVFRGIVVVDGEHLWAFVMDLPNQVLKRPAPNKLSPGTIFTDSILTGAMCQGPTQGYSWVSLQTILLFAHDPLKSLLYSAEEPQLLESGMIGSNLCHRVAARRPDGTAVFWIDEASHVLRRFEFPSDELKNMFAGANVENLSLTAELTDAQLNAPIDPNAFKFQPPPEAKIVEQLAAPGMDFLGKPSPAFTFVDLEGNQVTPESLSGKVVVLNFWATWSDPSRSILPVLETVYQKYKDNPKVVILGLNVDQPEVDNATVKAVLDELKVTLPIVRDPEQYANKAFGVSSIPTIVVLGSSGAVEAYEEGMAPGMEVGLPMVLENLLAGGELHTQKLEQLERAKVRFAQWLAEREKHDMYAGPLTFDQEPLQAEIAPRSDPKSLKLTPLWECKDLTEPGNLLVLAQEDGPPRILVIDNARSIAEISADGSVAAVHDLPVEEGQPARFLRSAVGSDGRRYFVVSANGALQLHLLDAAFRPLVAYPADAAQNPHDGIGDVQFGDLDGDGVLELLVGYWGVVGVQGVSLEGQRLWANRSLATVLRLAVLEAEGPTPARLLCTNQLGTLVVLGAGGKRQGEIQVPDLGLHWIVAADLDGDGRPELCSLAPTQEGHFVVVGVSLEGKRLWEHPLPPGVHKYPVEPITAGRLSADGPGQWLVAAADGSIHILSIDGQVVDQYHYGAALTGLATAELNGKPVLLVATPESLDAWQVEP